MKQKIPIYAYKNREYIGKFNSMLEAANAANITPNQVGKIARGEQKCTNKGYYFAFQPLTEEQIGQLPIKSQEKKQYIKKEDYGCKQKAFKREYEVPCSDPTIMYIPKNKEEKIQQFKTFLYKNLRDRWVLLPKNVVNLQKIYIREFLKSIE